MNEKKLLSNGRSERTGPNKWIDKDGNVVFSLHRPEGYVAHVSFSRVDSDGTYREYTSGRVAWRQSANERLENAATTI